MATYRISTLEELQAVKSHLAADCVLMNNIDASETRNWNERSGYPDTYYGFEPIGAASDFTGTFDGQNFTISNLYINRTNQNGSPTGHNNNGLFGAVTRSAAGGFIKDLNILNANITGGTNVGVLGGVIACASDYLDIDNVTVSGTVKCVWSEAGGMCGTSTNVTWSDCSSSCSVERTGTYVGVSDIGGFLGTSSGSSVFSNCSASGSVVWTEIGTTHNYNIGGFVGEITQTSDFDNCIATGNVTVNISTSGLVHAGGFAGISSSGTVTIDECFAHGDVSSLSASTAVTRIGGFIGYSTEDISKCGSEGDVESSCTNSTATNNCAGGFVGWFTTGTIANCYAKGNVCEDGVGHADISMGGFAGYVSSSGTLTNSYSVGAVYNTGTLSNGGGFLGVDSSGTYNDCFWDTETSGWATSDAGTGKTTTQMQTEATFTNWDFDAIWELPTLTRTPGLGNTIWLSEVGEYDNFYEDVKDSDSFSLSITSTNKILWLEALGVLIAGTTGDEWVIGTNELDTPITPTNFTADPQTEHGGKAIQAIKINDTVLFVDRVGRKVREFTYSESDSKYVAPDLTELAEHITSSGITSVARQKNPDSILWCTLTDGSLISLTYNRAQNVVAWAKHPVGGTGAEVQSVAVIPGTSEDEVWISVKRTINSSSAIYVERMASRAFTDLEDAFFVDSGITVENSPASTTISGLTHLIGETVKVNGDGVEYDPTAVVDGSGEVEISTAVEKAQVGLPFTYKLQPMRPDISGRGGTSHGSKVHVPEMVISFLNTVAARYGVSDSALKDIDFDYADWVNNGDISGLFTGDVVVVVDSGFSIDNPLIISDDGPMPCTIRALIPRMDVTER